MLFLFGFLPKMSNACQFEALNALFPMISGWCFWIKAGILLETRIIFQKEFSCFVGQSLAVFCAIYSFLLCSYITTREWQFSFILYNKNEIVYGVSSQKRFAMSKSAKVVYQISDTSCFKGHTLKQILHLASVCENTISELSLSQISALLMHIYSWFWSFYQFA